MLRQGLRIVDDAGGVPGACWFVAVVSHNGEHAGAAAG